MHSSSAVHIYSDNFVNEFDMINVIFLSDCLLERHQTKDFIHYLFFHSLTSWIIGWMIGCLSVLKNLRDITKICKSYFASLSNFLPKGWAVA